MAKLLPFRWYGGKYSHLDWLLPLLPQTEQYIEPFGGSAAVLLNREPSPVETFNDLDSDVTNFFKVLRDDKEELLEKIALSPFSREEFAEAIEKKENDDLTDIEQARLFFVRAGQVRSGLAQEATPGRWAYCKTTSRRDMSGAVSRWHGRLEQLEDVADRLRRVQIENRPAIEVIERHDDEDALFYCDPPYPHEARGDSNAYHFEMDDEEHRELAEALHDCEGKVALSSYKCDLNEELYGDWTRIDAEEKTMHTTKDKRQESLWVNYEPPDRDIEGVSVQQKTLDEAASND
jgi:DNA adenine methylase